MRKAKNLQFKGNSGRFREAKTSFFLEIFAVAKISLHIGLGFEFWLVLVVIWSSGCVFLVGKQIGLVKPSLMGEIETDLIDVGGNYC